MMYRVLSSLQLILSLLQRLPITAATDCSCNPSGFKFLTEIDSSILQDIRYYTPHNFMGRRVEGYNFPACILTEQAATALKVAQSQALQLGYTLKVYDCFRPQRAVDDFVLWSSNSLDIITKEEFYPTKDKLDLFPEYIASKSGHSRGSTVDLTLVRLPIDEQEDYYPGQPLVSCFSSYEERYRDNSIDMGTGFDCMSEYANTKNVSHGSVPESNRELLLKVMTSAGYVNYASEWWHYTLANEPYPETYFNFPIQQECAAMDLGSLS